MIYTQKEIKEAIKILEGKPKLTLKEIRRVCKFYGLNYQFYKKFAIWKTKDQD